MELADDISTALEEAGIKTMFDKMPPSHQREYIKWVDEAKKPETRARRIQKMCAMIQGNEKEAH